MVAETGAIPARFKKRLRTIFAEKELFFRSQGKVHFIRISSRLQIGAAAGALALMTAWGASLAGMAWHQYSLASDQAVVDTRAKSVAAQARKVDAYKQSVHDIAADLRQRQDMLDDIVKSQFGPQSETPQVTTAPAPAKSGEKISQAGGIGMAPLAHIKERQTQFARQLTALIDMRAQKAESAIRSFGLTPRQLTMRAPRTAQGGPFVPWPEAKDDAMTSLAAAFSRLDILERTLIAIPSGRPTDSPMLTSSYGYRRDPFNGHAAFHAGVDFPGTHGQPILAAAAGRVSYVGQRSGYGNVVEIDHGHGLMTRYAHLSGFTARQGQKISRGDAIGRMGSTGRSTGTHLHFEVRLNNTPVNPRRFLEVKDDVLKVQQNAKRRFALIAARNDHEEKQRHS